MTTPKSNPSKHYKHFRKAIAFPFRKLELCRHCHFRAGSFSGFRFSHICHVDRHGHFTLKQLRLPVLNESHTNSYTGPRLLIINRLIDQILMLQVAIYFSGYVDTQSILYTQPKTHQVVAVLMAELYCNNAAIIVEQHC